MVTRSEDAHRVCAKTKCPSLEARSSSFMRSATALMGLGGRGARGWRGATRAGDCGEASDMGAETASPGLAPGQGPRTPPPPSPAEVRVHRPHAVRVVPGLGRVQGQKACSGAYGATRQVTLLPCL